MTTTRTINFRGFALTVEYDHCKAHRGARERGTGFPLEPDEPESIELERVFLASTDISDLVEAHWDAIEQEIWELILSDRYDRDPDE